MPLEGPGMTCLRDDLGKGPGKLSGVVLGIFTSEDGPIPCIDCPLYWLVFMIMVASFPMQHLKHVFIGRDDLHSLLHGESSFGAPQVSHSTQIKFCHLSMLVYLCKGG